MIDCSKAENYFAEKRRMTKRPKGGICKLDCRKCPLCSENNGTSENLSCTSFERRYPDKAIAIIQKWSDEHPPKTYLSELLKNYPNTRLGDDETLKDICPYELGLKDIGHCEIDDACVKCWNQPIKNNEEGEEND